MSRAKVVPRGVLESAMAAEGVGLERREFADGMQFLDSFDHGR